jgi:hypothetical protein
VARIVIGIAVGEMRVVHARLLVEKAARPAARHRVETGNGECSISGRPERNGIGGSAEEAGGIDGGKPRAERPGYFLEISQCPTAR